MSTTSGSYSRHASGASSPLATLPTTRTSGRSSNSRCSVSRKVWLSSTISTRIGSGADTAGRLLGAEQQVIVGLSALVHLELDVGVRRGDRRDERLQRLRVLAGEQRQDPARLGEETVDHHARDLVERLAT